jgi:hypothetical protein
MGAETMKIRKNLVGWAAVVTACSFLMADAGTSAALARGPAGGSGARGGSWGRGGNRGGNRGGEFRNGFRNNVRRGGLQIGPIGRFGFNGFNRFDFNRGGLFIDSRGSLGWWGGYPYYTGYGYPNYNLNYTYPYYSIPYGSIYGAWY